MKKSFDLAEAVNRVNNDEIVYCVIITFDDSSGSFEFFKSFTDSYYSAIHNLLNINDDDLEKIVDIRIDSYNKNALYFNGNQYGFDDYCALRSMSIL